MAFTFYPTDRIVFPDYGGAEARAHGFALDDETGRICFKVPGYSDTGGWVIVPPGSIVPSFEVGGSSAGAPTGLYNDAPYWNVVLDGTPGYVFSSLAFGWISFSQLREPHAYLGPDGETWVGDGWYAFDRAPNAISVASVPSVPAGTFLNEIAAEDRATATGPAATPAWPRWERRSGTTGPVAPLGYYDPVGGATGVVRLGSLRFRDSDGRTWVQAADGKSYRASDGTTAVWVLAYGLWIIGTRRRGSSWAQCATNPGAEDGATFQWMTWPWTGSPEPDPEREDLVWTFDSLASSGERTTLYLAEVSAWR